MNTKNYNSIRKKISELTKNTFYNSLESNTQDSISNLYQKIPFTYQEFRKICEISIDFEMWGLCAPILETFNKIRDGQQKNNLNKLENIPQLKKEYFKLLLQEWNDIKISPTQYEGPHANLKEPSKKLKVNTVESGKKIYGQCPVASEKTVCCNLQTIDAVQNCGFGCTYCSIQTFYDKEKALFEKDLLKKLRTISIPKNKFTHFGSGQSSDALLWKNKNNLISDLFTFANENQNVLLEFKTKATSLDFLSKLTLPKNSFYTWSMNTDTVISNEEKLTPLSSQRIQAAKKIVRLGGKVGFHFHPVIYYENWEIEYKELIRKIMFEFDPKDVVFISIGTLTFIKPVIKELRKKAFSTKILQMPLEEIHGKYSYPTAIKEKLFSLIYNEFGQWQDKVFFYLCMEDRKFWLSTFNKVYANNKEFEEKMNLSIAKKLELI